ncbi:glycerate kinase [Thermoanaerobacterium thermosaccharolyticum DSM 571]|uniref:Glycerate kinase n=1 Tax=Thermoanaerobacterium thermosaccharolyticum (strain ATCC 7956 / DSM 571 / NCIMB 9385 / NCA 3814 / NCTC 13789 / WDCM 00135 / 2032) TaxID=580327 RepID=D9TM70_THETC|nr:glycerate kinase [Thermoanaerobacterium thermosaccharolyticum]ADL70047.1 glycerate kinase [Thermoanaerobacterium thermosaccharolyticum DSM 571]
MKILVAPDSFKGSLSSKEVLEAISEGIRRAIDAEIVGVPIADGGEGTVDALIFSSGGKVVEAEVVGPLGDTVKSFFGILNDGTAVIEMAASSGLSLVPDNMRNPLITTTYGVGQLIKEALDKGCRKFIIGLGGSATNDGGAGMIQALGVKLLDEDGKDIPYGGGNLYKLKKVDISSIDKRVYESIFIVASDVTNPLCGENGASAVYGPQKGATKEMVEILDDNLRHYASVVKETLGKDFSDVPGAGAAGGLGFSLMAFLNAKIRSGIDIVMEASNIDEKIKSCDIVITGEGNTDFQTAYGKAPAGIARIAKKYGKPVLILSGGLGKNYKDLYDVGVTSMFSIVDKPMTLQEAMINAKKLMSDRAEDIIRIFISGRNSK